MAARAAYGRWALRAGQLVIVDEASMSATKDLDYIATAAEQVGAKVLLVGDWAQLSPVQAGGAFKLLADARRDTPALHDVRRFRHEWERAASLKLRSGQGSVAAMYLERGRVESGSREDMIDLIFDGWATDVKAGRSSLMMASDAETVADLNTRARAHRIDAGEVSVDGVQLENGGMVGVGDIIVTRHNQRALVTGRGWVKNGDDWIVEAISGDGSVRARRASEGAVAQLPGDYVREHVELGYASTAHRAQGRTVDTAHAYVSAATVREPLYVMATRGRESNRLYVDTTYDPDLATSHEEPSVTDPLQVLQSVIGASGAKVSAIATRVAEEQSDRAPWRIAAMGGAVLEATNVGAPVERSL